MDALKYYLSSLADLAMPRCCMVCGRQLGTRENHLCIYCSADFPFTRFWTSRQNAMADRLNAIISRDMTEGTVGSAYERYSSAAALFFYHGDAGYKKIPQGLKYRKQVGAGRYFARLLAAKLFSASWFSDVDIVVPVPLHWKRRWERGYNQAEVIAAELARVKGCTLQTGLLRRGKYTVSQTRLGIEEKRKNVSGAFGIVPEVASRYYPSHILLADDVFTTGATMAACHHALRGYYGTGTRISAATLGFVDSG